MITATVLLAVTGFIGAAAGIGSSANDTSAGGAVSVKAVFHYKKCIRF